jgi:hypothetical protein
MFAIMVQGYAISLGLSLCTACTYEKPGEAVSATSYSTVLHTLQKMMWATEQKTVAHAQWCQTSFSICNPGEI